MWQKARNFYRSHVGIFTGVFLVVLVAIGILGPELIGWLPTGAALGLASAMILGMLWSLHDSLAHARKSADEHAESALRQLADIRRFITETPFRVYPNQGQTNSYLIQLIGSVIPRNADLLEYSSETVHEVIGALVAAQSNIRLLLQEPHVAEKAVGKAQRGRICHQIRSSLSIEFPKYPNLRIKCYKETASLRGRRLDDKFINLGWYTYDVRLPALGPCQIWGHDNPTITLSMEDKERFSIIKEMFDKVFDTLWREAVPLKQVCEGCPERDECYSPPPTEWLELVSKEAK